MRKFHHHWWKSLTRQKVGKQKGLDFRGVGGAKGGGSYKQWHLVSIFLLYVHMYVHFKIAKQMLRQWVAAYGDTGMSAGIFLCCLYSPCRAQFMLITAEFQRGDGKGGGGYSATTHPVTRPPPALPRVVGLQQNNKKLLFLCCFSVFLFNTLTRESTRAFCAQVWKRMASTYKMDNNAQLESCSYIWNILHILSISKDKWLICNLVILCIICYWTIMFLAAAGALVWGYIRFGLLYGPSVCFCCTVVFRRCLAQRQRRGSNNFNAVVYCDSQFRQRQRQRRRQRQRPPLSSALVLQLSQQLR